MKKYNINFPEDIFTQNARKTVQFKQLDNGLRSAVANIDVMFCGIVRNSSQNLERNIQRIKNSMSFFNNTVAFIYENNSTDGTKEILKEYEGNDLRVLSEDIDDANYTMQEEPDEVYRRCSKIAAARNKYMEFVEDNHKNFPVTVILDLDLIGGWSYEGLYTNVFNLLNNKLYDNIGAVTSYGVISSAMQNWEKLRLEDSDPHDYKMYDSFAFREFDWYKREVQEEKEFGLTRERQALYNDISRPSGNTKVLSNFGGLGIYKSDVIKDLRYRSQKYEDANADSEHVPFHRSMYNKKGKAVSINNRNIVSYSPHRYV
tara:strand:- start:4340 stop:5287 length:948 start_codon:yes stop_codon:yes gene_type:complete